MNQKAGSFRRFKSILRGVFQSIRYILVISIMLFVSQNAMASYVKTSFQLGEHRSKMAPLEKTFNEATSDKLTLSQPSSKNGKESENQLQITEQDRFLKSLQTRILHILVQQIVDETLAEKDKSSFRQSEFYRTDTFTVSIIFPSSQTGFVNITDLNQGGQTKIRLTY
jgi:hypothetical protein